MTDGFSRLGDDDEVVAALLAHRMRAAEVAVCRASAGRAAKLAAFHAAAAALAERLAVVDPDAAPWRHALAADLATASTPEARRAILDRAAPGAAALVPARARQLAVLIDLVTLPALVGEWVEKARTRVLRRTVAEFSELDTPDLVRVERELSVVLRRLRRSGVRWGRVAVVGAVGVGLGVVTMGAAAPLVGAALGGTALGLSGAAATSAGLAMLGGGSLAAGGFGMAGGAALLMGVGGLVGAGVGAGGARVAQALWCVIALEVVRVELHTRLVLLEEERDDATARRVVVLLQRRLDEVTVRLIELATAVREAEDANDELAAELVVERERAQQAEEALKAALERLREAGVDVAQDEDTDDDTGDAPRADVDA